MNCPFSWLRLKKTNNGLSANGFTRDPLQVLDAALLTRRNAVRPDDRSLWVGDPVVAREILLNKGTLYEDLGDFFTYVSGVFGPRSAQIKARNSSRALLREFLDEHSDRLPAFVLSNVLPAEEWPDAGNRIIARFFREVILATDTPAAVTEVFDDIVEFGILKSARNHRSVWQDRLLAFRTNFILSREITRRRDRIAGRPRDLLDVVLQVSEPHHSTRQLIDLFVAFIFSIVGSIGFLLSWTLYLAGTNDTPPNVPSRWIVQESLRLWPIAWAFERHTIKAHVLAGETIEIAHTVVACPYLVQRDSHHWERAQEFLPQRWADPNSWRNPAFIAFGVGTHSCSASDLAMQFVSEVLTTLRESYCISVTLRDTKVAAARLMAPPPYQLCLTRF